MKKIIKLRRKKQIPTNTVISCNWENLILVDPVRTYVQTVKNNLQETCSS